MKNRIIAIIIIAIILSAATLLTMNISDKEEKVESITSTTTQQTTTEITQEQTTTLAKAKKKKKKASKKKTKKKTKKKSTTKAVHTSSECKQYAYNELVDRYGWDDENDWSALVSLWNKESGWRYNAKNGSCYGIPQACPGSKMKSRGKDYKTNCYTQINWGLSYISARYGTPQKAWKHSKKYGWY